MLKFKCLKWLFAIICLFSFINGYSQADQVIISSGNTVSSFICGNKQIYTMGAGAGGGSTPIKVNIIDENNITLSAKQVSSGSGATFAALDCNSDAWAWGENTYGQVGNGTSSSTAVATPVRIKASSVIKSANKKTISGTDYLTNVSVIYTANLNSYAILNDGTLASWGKNSNVALGALYSPTGQLGDGTTVDKLTAVLVIDGSTNLPLDSVTQVYATDNVTFALSNGKVYSWGNGQNGSLGRNATGGKWTADLMSSKAYPVAFPSETGKISKIAAGDVIGMALDEFGYVWTWGNGGWNQGTGWGTSISSGVPQRVVKGSTSTANGDNDGTYLLAKDIDGGQGFAMAVTKSGAPVAWGGGGCGNGGATGNGTITGTTMGGPGYILTGPGVYDKDVINICRGDYWGFYVTKNNTIKTWGCNTNGQLGLGNTTSQAYAVTWTPPAGCLMRDPFPSANISTPDTTVCASALFSNPITLKASFVIDPTLTSNYKVTWYKNSGTSPNNVSIVKGDASNVTSSTNTFPATAANLSLSVTSPGKYNVEIAYIGTNAGCSIYPIAKDSLKISTFTQTFTTPTTLTYCGDSANVFVNSTSLTKPIYSWFPSATGTYPILGTSITSSSTKISVKSTTPAGNGDKVVYVEETSSAQGTILKKSQGCDQTWFTSDLNLSTGNIDIDQTFATGYTVYKNLTITQLSTMFRSSIFSIGQSGTATLTFAIYSAKQNNGSYVADGSKIIGTLSATYTRFRYTGEAQDLDIELTLKGNVTLNPGIYFIGPYSYNSTGNLSSPKIGRGNCALATGIVDDIDGTFIKQNVGVSGFGNPSQSTSTGFDFNVQFKTQQQYCDRVPVTLKLKCPCVTPKYLKIQPRTNIKDTILCVGSNLSLSMIALDTSFTAPNTRSSQSGYYYYWKKKTGGVETKLSTLRPLNVSNYLDYIKVNVTQSDTGTYYLVVQDGNNANCYVEASIKIKIQPASSAGTIGSSQTFCSGNKPTLLTNLSSGSSYNNSHSYSWSKFINNDWIIIPGATNSTFDESILINNGNTDQLIKYKRNTNAVGVCPQISTPEITLTIQPALKVGEIGFSHNISSSESPLYIINYSTSIGNYTYNHTWETSLDSINWKTIPNETNNYLSSIYLTNNRYFRRNDFAGTCTPVTSNILKKVIFKECNLALGDSLNELIPLEFNILLKDTVSKFNKGQDFSSTCSTNNADSNVVDIFYLLNANDNSFNIELTLEDPNLFTSLELINPKTLTPVVNQCKNSTNSEALRIYNFNNLEIGNFYILRLEISSSSTIGHARLKSLLKSYSIKYTSSITSTEITPIITTPLKVLSNIYNIQGIEVSKNYKGLVIYKYTDGSTEKRIQE